MKCLEYTKVDDRFRKYSEKGISYQKKILLTEDDIVLSGGQVDEMPSQDDNIFNIVAADMEKISSNVNEVGGDKDFSVDIGSGDCEPEKASADNNCCDSMDLLSTQDDQWLLELSIGVNMKGKDSKSSSYKVKMSSRKKYHYSSSASRKVQLIVSD